MQYDFNLLFYYLLMEFCYQFMFDYLELLEKLNIEDQLSLFELLRNIDSNQVDFKGLFDYYVNFFCGMYEFDKWEFIFVIIYYKQVEKKFFFVVDYIEWVEFYFKIVEVYYYMK